MAGGAPKTAKSVSNFGARKSAISLERSDCPAFANETECARAQRGDMGCTSQAISTWQWSNFLSSLATAEQQVVRINLDETCCPLCTEASKGAVAIGHNGSRKEAMMGEYRASLSARRSAVTLVASVCDDVEIQPVLPQDTVGTGQRFP